jgi:hypothetical protein
MIKLNLQFEGIYKRPTAMMPDVFQMRLAKGEESLIPPPFC